MYFLRFNLNLFAFFLIIGQVYSQTNNNLKLINDGPYILIKKKKLIEKKIVNGKVFSKDLNVDAYKTEYIPEKF